MQESELIRCWGDTPGLMRDYHDTEWGVPEHDDRALFEKLILDGQQAGLSWSTILNKRENFRRAYDGFDPAVLARYGEGDVARLLSDSGIVRNRLKVNAAITNARAYFELCGRHGSLDAFLWRYVDGRPIINSWESISQIPAHTELSDEVSAALKALGFKFVGSTIVYAFMQAIGMVDDHLIFCFRHGLSLKL